MHDHRLFAVRPVICQTAAARVLVARTRRLFFARVGHQMPVRVHTARQQLKMKDECGNHEMNTQNTMEALALSNGTY